MTRPYAALIPLLFTLSAPAQTLVDSIPLPDLHQAFWGIQVTPDTIFLGDDLSGDIYFLDHDGNVLGQQSTGQTFNHGLLTRNDSYLFAQDYTTNGAHLYEVALDGTPLGTWTFPDVIGGHSAGIGGLCADGEALWYTMYYPDFDAYPYAYAYKWMPGDAAPMDTVPTLGAQPLGIALKGDTLLYVIDNNDEDPERIYAYDLANEQDLGHVDLPDMATDGDQSPRGLAYDGTYLYLVANRSGGSAFAYQTIFIYAFEDATFVQELAAAPVLTAFPVPATDVLQVNSTAPGRTTAHLIAADGRIARTWTLRTGPNTFNVQGLSPGTYLLRSGQGDALRVMLQ